MKLSSENVVRASFLLLFLISSSLCLFSQSPEPKAIVAAFSLIGFLVYERLVHSKKDGSDKAQYDAKLEDFNVKYEHLEKQFKEIKNDLSVAKIATAIRR